MDNKYQEALDYLYENCYVSEYEEYGDPEEDTWVNKTPVDQLCILQELIESVSEMEGDHKIELKEMAESIEKYQKALDKSVNIILSIDKQWLEEHPEDRSCGRTKESLERWLFDEY